MPDRGELLGLVAVDRSAVRVRVLARAEALHARVLVERSSATHGVTQAVGERRDARSGEVALPCLLEQRVVGDLAEVPALAVQEDARAVDAVLLERQLVERVAHGLHVRHRVVPHEVEPEAVDLVLPGPQDHRVDHQLARERVLGRDVRAARARLDGARRVEPVVVAGHDLVEHGGVRLAGRRGVVVDLVEHDLEPGGVQRADHGAELADPCVRVERVRPLGHLVVERVVAPVEPVGVGDRRDARLLLVGVRRERREVARRRLLPRAVLLDGRDVEGGQQVHGRQPGARERGEVPGAGGVPCEREVRAALRGGHRLVGDREVAHVQLVDRPVHGVLDAGCGGVGPDRRPRARVRQVDDDRVRGVRRQRDRVRVRHGVLDDLARRRRVHRHRVPVGRTRPARLTGHAPHAVGPARAWDPLRRLAARTGPEQEVDVLCGGGPQCERRHVAVPRDAEVGVRGRVGVQVVDDARGLHPRERRGTLVGRREHAQLPAQQLGRVGGVHVQRGVPGERGEPGGHVGAEARRVVGQGQRVAAGDLTVGELEPTRARVVQREREVGRVDVEEVTWPRERVGRDPVRACLSRAGQRWVLNGHGEHLRRGVEREQHLLALGRRELDVVTPRDPARAPAEVPGQVLGDLHLVRAGRQARRDELVRPVAVAVLQQCREAVRLPVARAAELGLEVARERVQRSLGARGEQVRSGVVHERDVGRLGQRVGGVRPVAHPAHAVVLAPGPADRDLVLVVTGRDRERTGVDPTRPQRQDRLGAVRRPVARAAHLGVVAARDRDQKITSGLLRQPGGDREHTRRRVEAERGRRSLGRHRERDVAARGGPVARVPVEALDGLRLVAAGGDRGRRVGPHAVAVAVGEQAGQARAAPVRGAAELGLEAARDRVHGTRGVVRDAVRRRVVPERHRTVGVGHRVGDVPRRGVLDPVLAVVLVPGPVLGALLLVVRRADRGLVLVGARGQRERARPPAVGLQRELGRGAGRLPVGAAAHLGVVPARDRHDALGVGDDGCARPVTLADGRVRRGDRDVAARVAHDRAVLDERTRRQPCGRVEHARTARVGRAERRPLVVARDAVVERRLGVGLLVERDRQLLERRDRPARRADEGRVDGTRALRQRARRAVHDGRQGRDRELDVAVRDDGAGRAVQRLERRVGAQRRERRGPRRRRVVHRDQVLDALVAVDARERVHARAVGDELLDLRAVDQGGVACAQRTELGDRLVQRPVGAVVVAGAEVRAVDQRLLGVRVDLRAEQRLARVLVPAGADEALLVAVVDDRLTAREEHELVREHVALLCGVLAAQEVADAAHVVVAEERRQRVRAGVGRRVVVVGREQARQALRRATARVARRRGLEREVEHRAHVRVAHVRARPGRVGVVHLAEHEEVVLAGGPRVVHDLLRPGLPELHVHVLDRVDPEAVDPEVDPVGEDLRHAVDDDRVLGHEVVERAEVTERRGLPRVGRAAAVVVQRRVVEPRGHLDVRLGRVDDRGVRERRGGVELGERAAHDVGQHERLAVGVGVRLVGLRHVRVGVGTCRRRLRVLDHVRRVVRDDVEVDVDPAVVRVVDERGELGLRAVVRVDRGEVRDPVAVVAGRDVVGPAALDVLVREGRCQPDRGRAEALDVVEPVAQARDVAALVEALVRGVEARGEPVAGQAAAVVGRVAVGEPVRHDEVELLTGAGLAHGRDGRRVVLGLGLQVRRRQGRAAGRQVQVDEQACAPGQDQRDVRRSRVVGAREAVRRVPRVVGDDLELVPAPRQRHGRGVVPWAALDRGEVPCGAGGLPVGRAADLGLEVPDERVRRLVGGGGRLLDDERAGEGQDRGGQRRQRATCSRGGDGHATTPSSPRVGRGHAGCCPARRALRRTPAGLRRRRCRRTGGNVLAYGNLQQWLAKVVPVP